MPCSGSDNCDSSLNLSCLNDRCNCNPATLYNFDLKKCGNYSKSSFILKTFVDAIFLVPRKQFNDSCSSNLECDGTRELKCVENVCNCSTTKYYSILSQTCGNLFFYLLKFTAIN
jgi:hypothetical protein